ncbi:MAG: biopolymer transporter ExbD [Sulfuriferula sp.]|jgi:biopolymer transport protein ExbD|nr:biopolymer transporter ExbD [Sulfuriferula sp.]
MRRWQDTPRSKARIEIIPMIDVMMFLLVFFVLISLNVIPAQGLKTQLPQSGHTEPIRSVRNVVVTLIGDSTLQLEGKPVTLETLPDALNALRNEHTQLSIIINGDKAASLQSLVNVMDVLKTHGFDSLSIAAKQR